MSAQNLLLLLALLGQILGFVPGSIPGRTVPGSYFPGEYRPARIFVEPGDVILYQNEEASEEMVIFYQGDGQFQLCYSSFPYELVTVEDGLTRVDRLLYDESAQPHSTARMRFGYYMYYEKYGLFQEFKGTNIGVIAEEAKGCPI